MTDRPPPDPGLVSIVIPVKNEADSLPELFAQIAAALGKLAVRGEVVFVDDGSTDRSWEAIRDLAAADRRVRGLRFRRNFGKAAALNAGFRAANGGIVVTMDADLQDDPHELPRFLDAVRGGLDVVSGWKQVRRDPVYKVFPSRVFNALVSGVTGVKLHDHNCGYKAYRGEVTRALKLYGELHRFVPVLAAARGFTVGELVVHHRPRLYGRSNYGAKRYVKGLLDLVGTRVVTEFGRRPMHLFGTVGLLAGGLGVGGLGLLAAGEAARAATSVGMTGDELVVGVVLCVGLLLAGFQAVVAGLVAELTVARTAADDTPFDIAETTPSPPDPPR